MNNPFTWVNEMKTTLKQVEAETQSRHKPYLWCGHPQPKGNSKPEKWRVCTSHRAPQLLILAPERWTSKHLTWKTNRALVPWDTQDCDELRNVSYRVHMHTIFLPALCLAKVDRYHLFFHFPFLCSLWWAPACSSSALLKPSGIIFFSFSFPFSFFLFYPIFFFSFPPLFLGRFHICTLSAIFQSASISQKGDTGRLYTKLGPCFLHLVTQFLQLPLRRHPLIVWFWRPEGLHFWAPQRLYSWVPQYYNQWGRNL